jgi:hypothetical protein
MNILEKMSGSKKILGNNTDKCGAGSATGRPALAGFPHHSIKHLFAKISEGGTSAHL